MKYDKQSTPYREYRTGDDKYGSYDKYFDLPPSVQKYYDNPVVPDLKHRAAVIMAAVIMAAVIFWAL